MNRNDDFPLPVPYSSSGTADSSSGAATKKQIAPQQLLEDVSMHLSMPSFHNKSSSVASWTCSHCNCCNVNALSSECSQCGRLTRPGLDRGDALGRLSVPFTDDDEDLSSVHSFDGNGSLASLNWKDQNMTDATTTSFEGSTSNLLLRPDPLGDFKVGGPEALHSSLPAFNSSFSSLRSTRSTRTSVTALRHSTGRRYGTRGGFRVSVNDIDDDASVMSFMDWNPNEKVKSWSCPTCTFINENPLHLTCEMCGHRRKARSSSGHSTCGEFSGHSNDDEDIRAIEEAQMRELIEVQRDILSGLSINAAPPAAAPAPTPGMHGGGYSSVPASPATGLTNRRLGTHDLQRELNRVSASTPSTPLGGTRGTVGGLRSSMTATPGSAASAARRSLGMSQLQTLQEQQSTRQLPLYNEPPKSAPAVARPGVLDTLDFDLDFIVPNLSEDETNGGQQQQRIDDLLQQTKSLLADFKKRHNEEEEQQVQAAVAASVADADSKPPATTTSSVFQPSNAAVPSTENMSCLKYSMKAAGGKLHYSDLCLPLVWGDDLDSLKNSKQPATT